MKRSQHTNYKRWDADIYEYKKQYFILQMCQQGQELIPAHGSEQLVSDYCAVSEKIPVGSSALEIGQATKYDDLTKTVDAINDWIQENPESTEEEAKELYDAIDKKKIALNELTYESLNIGDFVWYENEVYTVFGKKKNKLDIRSIKGAPAKVATIAKNEVPTKLKKYFKPMDPKPPVSPEAQDVANENVANVDQSVSAEEKKSIFSNGKELADNPNTKSDFENTLGCE